MTFPYANVPTKFKEFMEQLRHVGIPNKATTKWLESIGYKSKNDRNNLKVLNFIGFIDDSSKPTDMWKKYRGADHKDVLGNAVKDGYGELYKTFPNAHELDDATLDSYFSTRTTSGKQVVNRMTRTFRVLAEMSEFNGKSSAKDDADYPSSSVTSSVEQSSQTDEGLRPSSPMLPQRVQSPNHAPSLHIDVQIHISSDMSADQIDQIFASMAKHLYAK